MSGEVEILREGALWTIALNRPDKANALTRGMIGAVAEAAAEAAASDARVLVLTGRGKVFSGGMDLAAAEAGLARDPIWEEASAAIAAFPGLSIAALNGTLAGGAFGMVLACDLRIAVSGAKFFYPVMTRGFLPQPSDPGRMTALIGPARTKQILMCGRKILLDEALSWGLVDAEVPEGGLDAKVQELAHDVLNAAPGHPAAMKAMI